MKSNYTKPLIKWIGGKTQIIDLVIKKFPREINNYHEPFLGGGSVLFALLDNIKNNKIKIKENGSINAYDFNETLINIYKNIKSNFDGLYDEIKKYIDIYNSIPVDNEEINRKPKTLEEAIVSQESYYYWIRIQFNKLSQLEKNSLIGSSYFIFLNKTCFRGMYREGPNGFNVPFGNYKNPEIINYEHLKHVSDLIQPVNFVHSSFENSFTKFNKEDFKEDFVYLDPPYAPETEKSFVGYTADGFSLEQHNLLFKLIQENQENQVKFLMSNADVDLVKNSFSNPIYTIEIISCKRSINSKKPNSKTNEVLISNF